MLKKYQLAGGGPVGSLEGAAILRICRHCCSLLDFVNN